ncbi:MAG: mobile mystery protein B [Bdellovibrionota bacterium]
MKNRKEPEGSTPLDLNESLGLIPEISTQDELNTFEQLNISQALKWAQKSRKLKRELLTPSGLFLLHRRMFANVWIWAGSIRSSEKNIGFSPDQIQMQLKSACEDTKYQIENSVDDLEAIAVRFHHRLTQIHAFPNGNGRHARLSADLLMTFNGQRAFSWGAESLKEISDMRDEYIAALREADCGDISALVRFAKI